MMDLSKPATTKGVRALLKSMGLSRIESYRSPSGYYYWAGDVIGTWPSIHSFNIRVYTLAEIKAEIESNLKESTHNEL